LIKGYRESISDELAVAWWVGLLVDVKAIVISPVPCAPESEAPGIVVGPAPEPWSVPAVSPSPLRVCVTTEVTVVLLWARAAARVSCPVFLAVGPQPGSIVPGAPSVGETAVVAPDRVREGRAEVVSAAAVTSPCVVVVRGGCPIHASIKPAEKG
jgi:hypothetical protein